MFGSKIGSGLTFINNSLAFSWTSIGDIIELLTFGSRFEDQSMLSNGFGVQATSVLGSLLETQLEKNLEEMSSLKLFKPT